MLLYPLYASVVAIESPSKVDDEQWLAYWILYSFLTLTELILQSLLEWIPIWYTAKLVFVTWLVLPQTRGAAFIYERFVREQFRRHGILRTKHGNKTKDGHGAH
ncbi:PREDICTED: HVA22-like protein e isoform X2 [Tarenaya hassleriana]|nr:PREDICTED: HVA22-like protein e isoform X2 [Tarenaya hassleriana]